MSGIDIVYDGECPFCASYVTMTRLKASVGEVRLFDAREGIPDWGRAYDINEGMLARHEGRIYYGADAVRALAVLVEPHDLWNRINRTVFGHPTLARAFYPLMRFGRNVTLRALGRTSIPAE